MSNFKIPNSIRSPKDLINLLRDRDTARNAREMFGNLPKDPEAHICSQASRPSGDFYFYKVFVQSYDSGTENIYDIENISSEEMAYRIAGYKVAYYNGSSEQIPKANEIWSCEFKTDNSTLGSIELKKKVGVSSRNLVEDDGSSGDNYDDFSGEPADIDESDAIIDPTTVSSSNPATDGYGWETQPGVTLTESFQVEFIQDLVERLKNKGWQYELIINSTYRTFRKQASIMITNERNDPGWWKRTYSWNWQGRREEMYRYVKDGNQAKVEELTRLSYRDGTRLSAHLDKMAFDIQTKKFSYSEVTTILDTLEEMKNDPTSNVRSYFWEKIIQAGYENNHAIRKSGGGPINNEHIHLSLKKS